MRLASWVLGLCVCLTLTGCGGGDSTPAGPRPGVTATPTATTSPSAAASPTVPPGVEATAPLRPSDQARSPDSAEEFGRYFAQLVQHGIETRNSREVDAEAFTRAGCTNCRTVAKLVSELKRTGYWQRSDPIELGPSRVVAMQGGFRVSGDFDYPRVENVRLDGEVVSTVPAELYRYWVDLSWDGATSSWRVRDFIYAKKS